jgi:hypothetical protein
MFLVMGESVEENRTQEAIKQTNSMALSPRENYTD